MGIVLPIVKYVLDRRLLGGVFYFFVEQIVKRSSGIIEGAIDKYANSREEIDNGNEDDFSEQARQAEAGTVLEKVGSGFDTAIKGIIMLLDVIWILATVLGLLALVILVIVFNIL